ncbi:MAG: VWA domain-containing protein [Desulfocapsaceae bacterium]|nr:VWA domain-containing protein [Desulfocapsaceae bacterium]
MFKLKIFVILALLCLPFSGLAAGNQPENELKHRIEVVFVLDTTGSMASLIDGAKKKIWSIANSIIDQNPEAEVYMGLVGYRDIGDKYVTLNYPLTTDIQDIYAKLLTFQAAGGGDIPESVNEALDVAVTKQPWTAQYSTKLSKIIFLVGDAPPHMDYEHDRKYPEVIKEAAQKNIIVNTVLAGDSLETSRVWKEIARLGKGDYMEIPQSGGKVVIIETPYDSDIIILQKELTKTVVPYGSAEVQKTVRGKGDMYKDAPAASAAEMSKYVSKSAKGKAVITGRGDLAQDVEAGKVKLEAVKEAELPANMQKMDQAERTKYIDGNIKERKELADKLARKVEERDKYIAEEKAKKAKSDPKSKDSFDKAVSDTLKKQL